MMIHSEAAAPEVRHETGKRERILRAAVDVFARTGYFNAKVSEIARAAGVADGTIYLYFGGKEDLLVTVFRENTRAFLEKIKGEIDLLTDPKEKVQRVIRLHLETAGADRALAVVFQVELRHTRKFMSLFTHQELGDYLDILTGIIDEGQRAGTFRASLSPRLIAKALFGILDEMMTSWILSEKEYRPADQAEQLADFVLRGLL